MAETTIRPDVPSWLYAITISTLVVCGGCATLAPAQPRFVVLYHQRNEHCQVEVMRDTRSTACFVAVRCGRQPLAFVSVAPEVCIP